MSVGKTYLLNFQRKGLMVSLIIIGSENNVIIMVQKKSSTSLQKENSFPKLTIQFADNFIIIIKLSAI